MTTAGRRPNIDAADNGATTGYEAEVWYIADALRGSMDAVIEQNLKCLGFLDDGEGAQ